ncbi:disulfide bond formation protein DsbA [candidate division KSB3 bacterium]|uniref:Disulfide bond formation protein DsbA n=1 Tax=candidate division KSB3 bacterium TaxID=2044937 RepID=A0A2G6KCE7_9BACT|nr:MAG: disulfide bond formation protein DsbA [candidate division KSB3 bacterium]
MQQPPEPEQPAIDEAQLTQRITTRVLSVVQKKQAPQQLSSALIRQVKDAVLSEFYNSEFRTQLKAELLAELQDGEFLEQHIEAGIQNFIKKRDEVQRQARAERAKQAQEQAKNVRRVSPERDHLYGNPDALISLIEYSDFECPYCKTFHATPREIVDAYDGQVNWVYRHYPLQFHNPGAQKQAEASECAAELGGNDAFWAYADTIYERTTSNGKGFPIEQLVPLAKEIGLDATQFQACLESGKYAKRVQDELQEGAKSGISGTPGSILLNNTTGDVKLMSGAQPVGSFKAEIDNMLQ